MSSEVKALGRCVLKHVNVTSYQRGTRPEGACKVCSKPLVEWAVKYPTAPATTAQQP